MRILLTTLGFLLFCFLTLNAQDFKSIDQIVEGKIDKENPGPGMAVGIVIDGEIVYERYIGMANLEFMIPNGPETKFNIASNAKQFTSLATLKLISEGQLKLHDDIRKYLPELLPNIKEPITIVQLMHHSAGIRDYGSLIGLYDKPWWKQAGLDNEDVYELLCRQKGLNFPSGTEYSYSNSNYTLLTLIIEKITGKSFPEYTEEMFQELGMNQTLYPGDYTKTIPNRSFPYSDWSGDGEWEHYPSLSSLYGDGFLWTTLKDQLEWEKSLQDLSNANEWVQLSQSKDHSSPDGKYGFGIEFRTYRKKELIRHAGSTGAYGAQFLRFPDQKIAIVVMGNSNAIGYYRTAYDIAAHLIEDLPEGEPKGDEMPKVSDKETPIAQWVGDYVRPEGQLIQFTERDGNLIWNMYGEDELTFTRESGDVFITEDIPTLKYHFEMLDGQAQFTGYYPGYFPRLHPGIADAPPLDTIALMRQNGAFKSTEVDTEIKFTPISGEAFTLEWKNRTLEGVILRSDLWKANNFTIHPEWDENGEINTLLVDYGGNENMEFVRIP